MAFFTQDDYLKIQRWLVEHAVKDTDFDPATKIEDDDLIAIVKKLGDNSYENRKVTVKDLLDTLGDQIWAVDTDITMAKDADAYNLDPQAVHFHEEQRLSQKQQFVARENIDALGNEEGILSECCHYSAMASDPTVVEEAVRWTPQVIKRSSQEQARHNISAASQYEVDLLNEKVNAIVLRNVVGIGNRNGYPNETGAVNPDGTKKNGIFTNDGDYADGVVYRNYKNGTVPLKYSDVELDVDGPASNAGAILRLLDLIRDAREAIGHIDPSTMDPALYQWFTEENAKEGWTNDEESNTIIDVLNVIAKKIGDADLVTDDYETLVGAINSLKAELGTTEKATDHDADYKTDAKVVVEAINELWKYVWGDATEGSDWPEPIDPDTEIFTP